MKKLNLKEVVVQKELSEKKYNNNYIYSKKRF